MKRFPILFLTLAAAASVGCKGAPKLSESEEYYSGRGVAAMAIEKDGAYPNPALQEYVTLVGLTIALESDRPETFKGYTFAILNVDAVNAFCAPSGFIFVTKGAIREMKSEDELAGVLAHEIGHVCLRHPELAAQRAVQEHNLSDALGWATDAGGAVLGFLGKQNLAQDVKKYGPAFGNMVVAEYDRASKGFSREEEFQADQKAVEYVTRSGVGYDPNAFKAFIARLPQGKQDSYGTHPGLEGRIKAIEAEIAKHGSKIAMTDPDRTKRFHAMKVALGQ